MKVLVIGNGAREHSLCWKIAQSSRITTVFCAPGNPGTAEVAENVAIPPTDVAGLLAFAQGEGIDLTVVGGETALAAGVVDLFRAKNLRIFGPIQEAARLESSKAFAKEVLNAANVPTAHHTVVRSEAEALSYLESHSAPIVLKADGLALGKGVVVCLTQEQVEPGVHTLFRELGAREVVIEQYLPGVEVSFIAAIGAGMIIPLATSHDYKRIGDRDQGPNTGGMGSVCPTPRLSAEQGAWVVERVMRPVVNEMARRGTPFEGFLYAGLMISPGGEIHVLEFNTRLGDPECQSIMRRAEFDIVDLFMALTGDAPHGWDSSLTWSKEVAVCVVMAAAGYPGKPTSGDEISGIAAASELPECVIFHAGTARRPDGTLVTAGGRVLSVTARGDSVAQARSRAYDGVQRIHFKDGQARSDIAT